MTTFNRAARGISLVCFAFGMLAGTAYANQPYAMPGGQGDIAHALPGFEIGKSRAPAVIRVAQLPDPNAPTELRLSLAPGSELVRGQRYWSQSGKHFLVLGPDGNLVVARADGGYVWGFDTQPNVEFGRVARVVWQDGNLAAYAADGSQIWSALPGGLDPAAELVLHPTGALQIVAGSEVKWSSIPFAQLPLATGTELVRGTLYWSQSGDHFLVLNPDGNLVVARADGGYVWGLDTQPNVDFGRVARVVWQEDGNLAAYAADGSYIWSALTENPDASAQLAIQPNGALQIVAGNTVMWSSLPDEPSQVAVGGNGLPVLTQTNTGDLNLAWTPDAVETGAPVAFVSTDGTAAIGSRSVFILHNDATGEATLVPVLGNESETRTVVRLAPGTYTVTPPAPSLGQYTTFTARNVSATQITVPESASDQPVATVSFSVEAQRAPFILLVRDVTAGSIELNWAPAPGVEVAEYVLVRTDGPLPATNPGAGAPVPLGAPTDTGAVVDGLQPNSEYTFTLFATAASGEALAPRAHTVTTLDPNSNAAAYSVAPNTVVPTDFASLQAERIGETWVRVVLDPAAVERGSSSAMPGVDASVVEGGGCAVGTPFLLTTDVAGDNSFFGVIDACESSAAGVSRAIVNTDVPMASVFSYYHIASSTRPVCYDPVTNAELDPLACEEFEGDEQPAERDAALEAEIAELQPPEEAGTGEVQVTLLWATGDDLDVYVTDPTGASINWDAATSASGGQLDIDNRGGDCSVQEARAENVFWDSAAPRGTYTVELRNYQPCSTPAQAKLQVRVGGQLVVDQIVSVGEDAPISFDVRDRDALWPGAAHDGSDTRRIRVSALDQAAYVQSLAAYGSAAPIPEGRLLGRSLLFRTPIVEPEPVRVAQAGAIKKWAKKSCETTGSARFNLNPSFGPHFKPGLKLADGTLTWDIEAGVKAGISPDVKFTGQFGCSLDIKGFVLQVSKSPIPVNLELKPDIGAAASATVAVTGMKLSLVLGIASKGSATASVEKCWWLPCGVDIDVTHKTSPLARFEKKGGSATIEGKLEFAAGVQANLGVGVKNTFVTAKAGFSLRMYPLAAELKGIMGTSNCVAAALGAKLGVDVLLEAYILSFGDEYRHNIYESDIFNYPGAKFEIGSCPDD